MNLPVLIFLSYYSCNKVIGHHEISTEDICYLTESDENNFWHDDRLFQMTDTLAVLGVLVTFMYVLKLLRLYQLFITVLGFLCVLYGAIFRLEKNLSEIILKQPFSLCELRILTSAMDYCKLCLFESGALVVNLSIMITLGVNPLM